MRSGLVRQRGSRQVNSSLYKSHQKLCLIPSGVRYFVDELAMALIVAHAEVQNVDSAYTWIVLESLSGKCSDVQ